MKKQFAEQFKVINKNFGEVFVELFGGGKGDTNIAAQISGNVTVLIDGGEQNNLTVFGGNDINGLTSGKGY